MATQAKRGLSGKCTGLVSFHCSMDDTLEDLLRYDVEPHVTSGSSGGRAWSTSVRDSKKMLTEEDFFSKVPGEDKAAAGDKDDRDWDFLGTSKPSSGPRKMPVKRGTERSSETTAEQSSRKELGLCRLSVSTTTSGDPGVILPEEDLA